MTSCNHAGLVGGNVYHHEDLIGGVDVNRGRGGPRPRA